MKVEHWHGAELSGSDIAIAISMDRSDCLGLVDLIAVANEDGQTPVCIKSEDLGNFLVVHADRRFICFDAADLHWKLVQHLKHLGEEDALKVVWDLPRHGRLHDVQLLEQRLRLVREGVNPLPRELDALVKAHCQSNSHLHQTQAILEVYQQLLSLVEPMLTRLEIDPKLVERFGPLGHGVDVQGAIAVHAPNRELKVSEMRDNEENDSALPNFTDIQWNEVVAVLLKSVPRGHSTDQLCWLIQGVIGIDNLPKAQVQRLHVKFKNGLCPELTDLLNDGTVDQVARNVGTHPVTLYERLSQHPGNHSIPLRVIGATLRNVIFGKRKGNDIWLILHELAMDSDAQALLNLPRPNETIKALLRAWPVTPLGRVGLPCYSSQARSAACFDFADDVLMRVLFEIAAAGFSIVAINGPEFVITAETKDERSQIELVAQLKECVGHAEKVVFGSLHRTRVVPLELSCDFSSCW